MARTYLYHNHVKLGAKMVDFAGWDMPVQYTSIIEEHNNVRNNAGLFDVSHMGEIFVSGSAIAPTLCPGFFILKVKSFVRSLAQEEPPILCCPQASMSNLV